MEKRIALIGIRNGLLASLTCWLLIAWLLTGCSVKFEVGYHGTSEVSNLNQTKLNKKPERY